MQSVFPHLSLSNVSKSVHVHNTVYEVFSTILPKNTRIRTFPFTQKEKLCSFSVIWLSFSLQCSLPWLLFSKRFSIMLLYTTLHKKQTFSLLNLEEFSSILKKNSRRKKSSLFLKATIHFDSSRTTSKWVGPFLLQTFSSGFPLVWCLLLFLSLIPTFYCLEWLHL